MFFQEEFETMPREQLRELQLLRMRDTFKRCYDNVDFYKKAFNGAGVVPEDLKSLDDLRKFPFTVKQDMRDAYPYKLFAVPMDKVARIHASSGTTGQATVVGHTAGDLARWGECFARGIRMADLGPGTVMQVAYGYGLFTGGLGAHVGGEVAGCCVIPASSGNTKRQIQMIKDMGVELLACTPSYALLIADSAIEMGYDPAVDFKLKAGIFGAEPSSDGMRREIAQKLGIRYCDVYGLSEIMGPGVAMECGHGEGLHFAEDHFYPEIIDPDTLEPLPDGEWGELVITTLTRECTPLVRYRTRDISRIIAQPCSCGRTHRRIDRIIGRTDDMLIIRGVNVFPSQIEQVIAEVPGIATQYQITVGTRGSLDYVELAVEMAPDFVFDEIRQLEGLKKKLAAELKSNLQIAVDIRIVEPHTIERSEGKAKRVIDLRKNTGTIRGIGK
ncbi:MAG: phenylacetate--CoA ligase [Eggerthellaceae bacterium]|nr:phenylacetate--CoA ligase [Eggerthellaceae bacterium]